MVFFWGRLRVPTRRSDLVVPADWGYHSKSFDFSGHVQHYHLSKYAEAQYVIASRGAGIFQVAQNGPWNLYLVYRCDKLHSLVRCCKWSWRAWLIFDILSSLSRSILNKLLSSDETQERSWLIRNISRKAVNRITLIWVRAWTKKNAL